MREWKWVVLIDGPWYRRHRKARKRQATWCGQRLTNVVEDTENLWIIDCDTCLRMMAH
jgi:hypothetical protein